MTTTANAEKTVEALEQMFTTHGLPNSITTDSGPQFISQYFKQYCEQNRIVHRRTTALWPQANGEIERQHDPYSAIILYYEVSVSLQLFRDDPRVLIQ
jgi:transposase InsO family protein